MNERHHSSFTVGFAIEDLKLRSLCALPLMGAALVCSISLLYPLIRGIIEASGAPIPLVCLLKVVGLPAALGQMPQVFKAQRLEQLL